jgi:hypothetical protein
MADEIAASIFGDPNPSMTSSFIKSLHHTIAPPFFDSSMCTGPERIGLHRTTTSRRMISRGSNLKLQRTPIPSLFLMIVDKGGEELD